MVVHQLGWLWLLFVVQQISIELESILSGHQIEVGQTTCPINEKARYSRRVVVEADGYYVALKNLSAHFLG